ncbi:MAG: hypothetical protein IJ220_07155 [Clostridia bacterium]|nr:hypothetical protein [Clostridia bacterium]
MKEKKTEGNSNEKLFWMIGISLIVFLVLVLVSVIILKNVRNKIYNMPSGQNVGGNTVSTNYEVLDNGVKRNNSESLARTEIDVGNVRFSHFSIMERDDELDENNIDTDITFDVENMEENPAGQGSYIITLYDSADTVLTSFTVRLESLPAREPVLFRQNLAISCVDTARVEVEKINIGE